MNVLSEDVFSQLKNDRILLTGGAGFLGSYLRERLEGKVAALCVPRSRERDLRQESAVVALFEEFRPTLALHTAAVVGGIGFNQENPARLFDDNVRMNFFLLEKARHFGVRKFVGIGSICAYPKFTPVPFREEDLWEGYPEETNAPYGFSKKFLLVQSQAYARQYGFDAIHLLVVNLYGPRDNFSEERSHVIPALIRRFVAAKEKDLREVVCWGDGTATREFLYVEDGAEGALLGTALYDSPEPVNIGSGYEISIKELAETVAELTGYDGQIVWDASRPNGQPRRLLDTTKAEKLFGFRARTPFREGLRRTIEWFRRQESEGDAHARR